MSTKKVSQQDDRCNHCLPRVVDEVAIDEPNRTWIVIPNTSNLDDGWRTITFSELSHAVSGFARWVVHEFGRGDGNSVIAYMGYKHFGGLLIRQQANNVASSSDQMYPVVIIGLIKSGYQVSDLRPRADSSTSALSKVGIQVALTQHMQALLLSVRNSPEGQASLIHETQCRALLHGAGIVPFVRNVETAVPSLPRHQVPTFDELCRQGSQDGLYEGSYNESETARVLVLHTSGSTGLPKPVYVGNGALATVIYQPHLQSEDGRENCMGMLMGSTDSVLVMAPFFHTMGIMLLARTLLCKGHIVALPPGQPPSAQLVLKVLEQKRPWGAVFIPALLEEISSSSRGFEALTKVKKIWYGGAPLAHVVGERLSEFTQIIPVIGSTEAFAKPSSIPADKADFDYFEWSPRTGFVMEPQGDGTYELVIRRGPEPRVQAVFYNFPELDVWHTKDLFTRHPTKPDLWKYNGRKDDVLVLSNGEKVNPISFEKMIENEPLVKAALVVGEGRFQAGLLIEPNRDLLSIDKSPTDLIDSLWPTIEKANAESPSHGRIWKSKVAIAVQEKPFRRAPKGSVVRRGTVALYKAEIDALYSNEVTMEQLGALEKDADRDTIKDYLRRAMKAAGVSLPADATDDADLFSFGVDSLQILGLSSILSSARSQSKKNAITTRDIYEHASVASLAAYLHRGNEEDDGSTVTTTREEGMAALVDKYTAGLATSSLLQEPSAAPANQIVILTGSTGSLGNYILEQLISSDHVAHIYCFNRSADAATRQKQTFASRGYDPDLEKVTFLHTDLSQDHFGLSKPIFNTLLSSVNIIIHNAWAVDFNKTLASYESVHIAGTRRLVDFSIASQYRAKIVFISSIASVGNWLSSHASDEQVPENIMTDHSVPSAQGYGESKHVAEIILATAAERSGVPVTIIRAGQLAGPSDGRGEWNRHEWVPSLVLTSKAMGLLPDSLGGNDCVDWVPMDWAAKSVWELAIAEQTKQGATVAHLVNPATTAWSLLVPMIREALGRGAQVEVVPFKVWVEALRDLSTEKEEIEKKPAVKLLSFFESLLAANGSMPRLATTTAAALSEVLKTMGPVNGTMLKPWIEKWLQ
jgi:thioester reductase-like protein